jgi:hypothetical protein
MLGPVLEADPERVAGPYPERGEMACRAEHELRKLAIGDYALALDEGRRARSGPGIMKDGAKEVHAAALMEA